MLVQIRDAHIRHAERGTHESDEQSQQPDGCEARVVGLVGRLSIGKSWSNSASVRIFADDFQDRFLKSIDALLARQPVLSSVRFNRQLASVEWKNVVVLDLKYL